MAGEKKRSRGFFILLHLHAAVVVVLALCRMLVLLLAYSVEFHLRHSFIINATRPTALCTYCYYKATNANALSLVYAARKNSKAREILGMSTTQKNWELCVCVSSFSILFSITQFDPLICTWQSSKHIIVSMFVRALVELD